MPLSQVARIVIDPRHVLDSRWAHDAAHALAEAVRAAPPPPKS